ncbi:MAG: NAD-glutamate dehydrogenase [Hyphomonadaceae bacterium]|jgi:glutamate dehydrogenase|nr:NAD-glutamate dehydrogenase [Hyphomonadaceae bacterium]
MTLTAETTHNSSIRQVQMALGEKSQAAQFVPLLYGRNGFDGPGGFATAWLADNARAAFEFIVEKPRDQHKLRVRSVPAAGATAESTVVEILNDDMPFLVDSVMGELQARGLTVHFLLHPIFKTERDRSGRLRSVPGPGDQNWNDGRQESYIAIHLPALTEAARSDLAKALSNILTSVRVVVADWQPMLQQVKAAIRHLEIAPRGVPAGELRESVAFLRWLEAGNFTFLGSREYHFSGPLDKGELVPAQKAGLGVLRDPGVHVLRRGSELVDLTPEIRRFYATPAPLIITKANVVSRVHRRVHMDYIGIKTYRRDGTLDGEIRIVGLFTSQAYVKSPREIPFLRHKVETVLKLSGYPAASHAGKALVNLLETFPRDELFQIEPERLHEWSEGILDLETRPRVRVFARIDRFDRFVSTIVYVPRDRYTSGVRERIGVLLAQAYQGRIAAFYPYFTDGPLVRVQFIVGRYEGATPHVEVSKLERGIGDILRTWGDRLADAITASAPRPEALLLKYRAAFSAGYAETFPPPRALEDIKRIERLGPDLPVAIDFYREADAPAHRIRAAIYRIGGPINLSERVPLLENMGFLAIDERSYRVHPHFTDGTREVTLHNMVLETVDGAPIDLGTQGTRLEDCFLAVFHGRADNDSFNRLVIAAGADWRTTATLRAYAAFLRQLGSPFGLRYLADTLYRHAGVARDLLELFHLRFDPARPFDLEARKAAEGPIRARIEGALAAVPSLDEDRILRQLLNLVGATVRTNFFQTSGADRQPPQTIAFKLDSNAVDAAPQPRPYREIWVYSPRVEGVHLRFAPIARGGIRWSDRAQDFRTEVLGLVRAQVVKNAVIVPSGAKGGFVPKLLPRSGTRDDIQKEGVAAYRIFISALLDITDNLKNGRIVPPQHVVRHDGDDPYLVVAADKGTATFSDIANELSVAHDFWLSDAFASGGSVGYDHKGMAITARGAWECVKRHFREMDIDVQTQPIRAVGVGDMSGDVFGNGMLLSDHVRLVAAFDHRDIFIDPHPPADAIVERRRLFNLPRSSWQDYDKGKISKGGGVFSRSSKSISVTEEMKALLDLNGATITPAELIRAVLKCKTDLLWFGGIGTYVRASSERDEEVGDRANDPLRIAAAELNAHVVGEGANLGVTQRGRIEFAGRGGRINTDFIDNSAGVNTSDQEVNIKIAMAPAVRAGKLDPDARKALLADMTDDVAAASLRNNYQQSLALSLAERRSARNLPDYMLLMRALEARGLLARALEALPGDGELQERARAGRGLSRPELAVLLSYAKIALQHDILQSTLPDEPQLESWLLGYFPPLLRERYRNGIDGHSLRREIIALGLTNAVVNRGGPTMAVRLASETRKPVSDVAHAFMAAREVFDLPRLWQRIDALDGRAQGEAQLRLYEATQDLVNAQTRWFLRDGTALVDLAGTIARHKAGLATLSADLENILPPRSKAGLERETRRHGEGGIPADLATDIARLSVLAQAPSITEIARASDRPIPDTSHIFLAIGDHLRIADLAAKGIALATSDQYDRLAIAQAISQLAAAQAAFTRSAIAAGSAEAWYAAQGERLARLLVTLDAVVGEGATTVSRLLVAAGLLSELAATPAAPSA